MMVELVEPSNNFKGIGGIGVVGNAYFLTICDSIKQSEEPQSRSVTRGVSGRFVHVKLSTKEFFEGVEETAFKMSTRARLPQSSGRVVPRLLIIFLIPRS